MASTPIVHVVCNKYIVHFQGTYAIRNNIYNYKKLDQRTIP